MKHRNVLIWLIVAAAITASAAITAFKLYHWRPGLLTLRGAVIRADSDSGKQLPISNALVTVSDGVTSASTHSDATGYFSITLPGVEWPGKTITLMFRQEGYRPLDLAVPALLRLTAKELYVAAMTPNSVQADLDTGSPQSVVSNIRIRYTVNSEIEENIGSAARTFQVINRGNVPCDGRSRCSPDGNWKAASKTLSLDAGRSNEFRDVRASCIAGPCPFTRIDSSGYANGGRNIQVTAIDWSDTATFLLEAEVFHTAINSSLRESFPVIFGRALNFTVPPTQEGVSIEADIDGVQMVFPLGPELYLSWATCHSRPGSQNERSTVYLCELKPGYRF